MLCRSFFKITLFSEPFFQVLKVSNEDAIVKDHASLLFNAEFQKFYKNYVAMDEVSFIELFYS